MDRYPKLEANDVSWPKYHRWASRLLGFHGDRRKRVGVQRCLRLNSPDPEQCSDYKNYKCGRERQPTQPRRLACKGFRDNVRTRSGFREVLSHGAQIAMKIFRGSISLIGLLG